MKRLVLLAFVASSCSKPFYAQKDGDIDVAIVKQHAGCGSEELRACELLDAFAEGEEIPLPKKTTRFFGFFNPSNKGFGTPIALILEPKNGMMSGLVLPWKRARDADDKVAKDFLKDGSDGGNYDVYFEHPSQDPYPAQKYGKSYSLHDIGLKNFLRKKGKRIILVQVGDTNTTKITWAQTNARLWVGELRQLD
jgi:hypothetical protein